MQIHMHASRVYSETMSLAPTDLPRRHRLTVSDYYRMAEVGILAPDARVELIDGEIIDMPPPGSLHAATVRLLQQVLSRKLEDRATVIAQDPVRLGEHSEPQPDLAVLRHREDLYRERHPQPADVFLVVEVAVSSLRFDRVTKQSLYAAHGIPEFWIVDLRAQRLIRHRVPRQGSYTLVDEPDLEVPPVLSALPGIDVDLERLFGS
jgi:Uma2 family endonuclease